MRLRGTKMNSWTLVRNISIPQVYIFRTKHLQSFFSEIEIVIYILKGNLSVFSISLNSVLIQYLLGINSVLTQ